MKVGLVTAPMEEANGLARRAVESGVAACVNVLPGVTSHYVWDGVLHSDPEVLLIAKVADEKADDFVNRMREWHSYSCPEVILVDVIGGNPDYIRWVSDRSSEASEA